MKKPKAIKNIFAVGVFLLSSFYSAAQVLCIYCYDQNDSISQNVSNYISNSGFESSTCVAGSSSSVFCPNSFSYSCDITDWDCTGGGMASYCYLYDTTLSEIVEGNQSVYFGNYFAYACGSFNDLSCLSLSSCEVVGIPVGYPLSDSGYGNSLGVSLQQNVTGLIVGNVYVLEFWAGGESVTGTQFTQPGIFSVDLGFGNIFLQCPPTPPDSIGKRYIIIFKATSTSHLIKFTNWGHVCIYCTELVLDDVRLYPLSDLSPSVTPCVAFFPSAMFSATDTVCPGTCIDFINQSLNATSYQWLFPGAIPDTSTAINPTNICYTSPGNYDVQLIATNANGSDTLLLTNYITVYPFPPSQSIIQSGDTLFAIAGSSSYQWYFNGNIIIGATDYFYIAQSSGDYNVIATDAFGCEAEAVINNVLAGLTPTLSKGEGVVFPNPVEDRFTMHNSQCIIGTAKNIRIYNVMGENIYEAVYREPLTVNCEHFPSGIYYLEIISDKKIYRTKFIKK